ncbi:MAG: tetratricopeptide repeat protein [Okeania sp. SIO3C4]|nr:tetratricopeptide repeat protein [Okeania sp. SIO3C4]
MPSKYRKTIGINIEIGFNYLRASRLKEAEAIANQLLSSNPNHHGAINLSGLIFLKQGQLEQAIRQLYRAVKLNRSEPIYQCNLGAAYRQSHRYNEAIAACQKALKLRPNYSNALITLASTYFAAEQYEEALATYEQAIAITPEQALLYAYRGDALRELGRVRSAIQSYEQALKLSPDLPHAISNFGLTLLEVGQPERALEYCRRAAEYEPKNSQWWMYLGIALRTLGQLEEAMDAYGKAYDLNPDSAMLCTLIGNIWQEISELQQAIGWYDKALAIEPERLDSHCAFAGATLDLGDSATAITRYREIIEQHPNYYKSYLGLSQALWEDGEAEEAIAVAYQAVALKPENASTRSHLATILASAGDVEAANAANREALTVNPNCIPALVNLAQNLRGKLPEVDVQKMEQLLGAKWARERAKTSIHFGLAHYYDGCKNYGKAATHAIAANKLHTSYKQERGWDYNPDDYTQYIDKLIANFNAQFFQRTQGMGNPSTVPIFIVGMPRSGTTLTEQILASHPLVFGAGERSFAGKCFNSLPRLMGNLSEATVWDCLPLLTQLQINQLADWHLAQLEELTSKVGLGSGNYQRIVDKMPDNYSLLGWIVTAFPNAKIIHCRRDVRDVAVSCWMTQFKSIRWAFDLTHIAERIKQYWRIMEHWRRVLPVPMLEIDYEETVANQTAQTLRLLDFIGLEWDDACMQFHKTERLVRTASVTQVRQPIYKRSVERWRRYEDVLQPLLELLA